MDEEFEIRNANGASLEISYYGGPNIGIGASDGHEWGGGIFTPDEARLFANALSDYADEAESNSDPA